VIPSLHPFLYPSLELLSKDISLFNKIILFFWENHLNESFPLSLPGLTFHKYFILKLQKFSILQNLSTESPLTLISLPPSLVLLFSDISIFNLNFHLYLVVVRVKRETLIYNGH
jgi:hypothetical protein